MGWLERRGLEQDVGSDYITADEASKRFGLHRNTISRLVRAGVLYGYKANVKGRRCWLVAVASLYRYADPYDGFLRDLPGPKLYLRRSDDDEDDEPLAAL